jgi:hypothetical protein
MSLALPVSLKWGQQLWFKLKTVGHYFLLNQSILELCKYRIEGSKRNLVICFLTVQRFPVTEWFRKKARKDYIPGEKCAYGRDTAC